jgi:hypothetical protein
LEVGGEEGEGLRGGDLCGGVEAVGWIGGRHPVCRLWDKVWK